MVYASTRRLMTSLLLLLLVCGGCIDLGVPHWSIDSKRIVYTRLAVTQRPEVWMVDLDSLDGPKRVAGDALRPQWSADGGRVFYLALVGKGDGSERAVLRSCEPTGADVRDHAPGAAGDITWYGLAAGGGAYFLRGDTAELFSLDTVTGRAARLLAAGARCRAAAVDPYGRTLVAAVESTNKQGQPVLTMQIVELGTEKPVRDTGLAVPIDAPEGRLTMLVRPNIRDVIVMQNPGVRIGVVPLAGGKVAWHRGECAGEVVFASCSPDGRTLHVTTVTDVDGARFSAERIDLGTGQTTVVHRRVGTIVGGRGWGAGGGAYAELGPCGLVVASEDGRWERLYPAETPEVRAAAASYIERGEPEEAVRLLERNVDDARGGDDVQALYLLLADAHATLKDRRAAADAVVRGWLLAPISDTQQSEVTNRVTALRGEDRLISALDRALRQAPAERSKSLFEAKSLVADPRLLAGLDFRSAEAAYEAGDYVTAAKRFRVASEISEFPAADYALGLAAATHFIQGRNDAYAEELLLRAIDQFPTSPLNDDFRAFLGRIRDPAGAVLRRTAEAGHANGFAAWVTVRAVRSAEWASSARIGDSDGTLRRLVARVDIRSSLVLARPGERGEAVLVDLPAELGGLQFSPNGAQLAFLAKRTTAGAERPAWAALYVADMAGRLIVGDAMALFAGLFAGDTKIGELSWVNGGRSVKLQLLQADGAPGTTTEVDVVHGGMGLPAPDQAPRGVR
jgi:tetratricopeptide (TPR) repeat protein